jgi:hypothetical protein
LLGLQRKSHKHATHGLAARRKKNEAFDNSSSNYEDSRQLLTHHGPTQLPPQKLVGGDHPCTPRLGRKAGKKKRKFNHQQESREEQKSTYDDPWRRLMMMTKDRLAKTVSRKSYYPCKHTNTKEEERAPNPNYGL